MKIRMYQVDAFTDKLFGGNPAAVCILGNWIDDDLMLSIAAENNLAETAFILNVGSRYGIRWFTPAVEVDLCGHATLAAAHVIFNYLDFSGEQIEFYSHRSGVLRVKRTGDTLTLDFPVDIFGEVEVPLALVEGLGAAPVEVYLGKTDYMAVFPAQKDIERLRPDYVTLARVNGRGVIVTARGDEADFVSRFFAPQSGINEDPVTGSAHTTLTPYWSRILGKSEMTAIQISPRRGHLFCKNAGDRVEISGRAVTYLRGEIDVAGGLA